jgi:hypothetical protein
METDQNPTESTHTEPPVSQAPTPNEAVIISSTPEAAPVPMAVPVVTPAAAAQTTQAASTPDMKQMSKVESVKGLFYKVLLVCLLGAAGIAVVAVLVGSFSDILFKALGTIVIVALHAAVSFAYITENEKRDIKDGGRRIEMFNDAYLV